MQSTSIPISEADRDNDIVYAISRSNRAARISYFCMACYITVFMIIPNVILASLSLSNLIYLDDVSVRVWAVLNLSAWTIVSFLCFVSFACISTRINSKFIFVIAIITTAITVFGFSTEASKESPAASGSLIYSVIIIGILITCTLYANCSMKCGK